MDIVYGVLKAVSEAVWGDTWPAKYIHEELINKLSRNPRRLIRLATCYIQLRTIPRYLKPFTRLDVSKRRTWIEGLSHKSLAKDMMEIIQFLLSAVYFNKDQNRTKIGYERKIYLNDRGRPLEQPKLSHEPVDIKDKYDAVVVGSGAGGAVVAWKLCKAGYKVAVFEAGPEPSNVALENPVDRAVRYYWDNGLTFTMGRPVISLPFGKVLGGTVTVNSGTLFRATDKAFRLWREVSGVDIDRAKLDNAYSEVEKIIGAKPVPPELLGNNALVMRRGAENLGLRHYPVRRPLGGCIASGECAFVCPNNGKIDMRLSFLSSGARNGLEIYCNTIVERVVIRSGKAVGVEVRVNNRKKIVNADVVVVSAGALNTPRILRRSGVNNRNLGKHLHIHPAAGVTALMNYRVDGWRGTMQSYCVDELLDDYDTLLLATFPPPGIGYSAGSIPLSEIDKYPYLASIGVQTSDTNEGEIPSKGLMGIAKYDLSNHDKDKLSQGILLATEILLAAGAEKVYLPLKKTCSVRSLAEAKRVLEEVDTRGLKLSAYHPMSTARIGIDEETGVVDEYGRVYGFDNLYLADASILPSTTIVNPQLTINALSLVVAENIIRGI